MLDKVIEKHIDKIDELEDAIDADIDRLISEINIDEVMKDPEIPILEVVGVVRTLINEKYAKPALQLGRDFASVVENMMRKDEDIEIPKSTDPKLNEELGDNGNQD